MGHAHPDLSPSAPLYDKLKPSSLGNALICRRGHGLDRFNRSIFLEKETRSSNPPIRPRATRISRTEDPREDFKISSPCLPALAQ